MVINEYAQKDALPSTMLTHVLRKSVDLYRKMVETTKIEDPSRVRKE